MKKIVYSLIALCALATGTAQASIDFLSSTINDATQEDYFSFKVDTAGDVNLYTSALAPFDTFLTFWSASSATPTTADLTLLGSNDNTTTLSGFESGFNVKDAQLKFSLVAGDYFARITAIGSTPFDYDFNVDTTNIAGTGAVISNFTAAVAPAAVPLPAAVWMFGTGLMGFLGLAKRKGQQTAIC